jgi:hypothetical protein
VIDHPKVAGQRGVHPRRVLTRARHSGLRSGLFGARQAGPSRPTPPASIPRRTCSGLRVSIRTTCSPFRSLAPYGALEQDDRFHAIDRLVAAVELP